MLPRDNFFTAQPRAGCKKSIDQGELRFGSKSANTETASGACSSSVQRCRGSSFSARGCSRGSAALVLCTVLPRPRLLTAQVSSTGLERRLGVASLSGDVSMQSHRLSRRSRLSSLPNSAVETR
jgi:hypothetical protein